MQRIGKGGQRRHGAKAPGLRDLDFSPGAESLEVKLYEEDNIPWNELAFATIRHTLQFYFEDRQRNKYQLRIGDIVKEADGFGFLHTPG